VTDTAENTRVSRSPKSTSLRNLVWGPMAPRSPVVSPWLERGSAVLVWGPTGVGKSYFAQTLALTIATGGSLPNLGWRTESTGKVLWFDGEQGLRTAQARARQLVASNGRSPIAVPPDVLAAAEQGKLDRNLVYRNKVVRPEHCPDIGVAENRQTIEKVVKDGQFDLVIFDNIMVLATVESWDDAAALADLSSWFNYMAKRRNCAVIVMHHAKKDGSSYNGSARIGQDFEVIASLQPIRGSIPPSFAQIGPAFVFEFLKMRDQPPGWNAEPLNMVLCADGWRTFEREDLGYRAAGMKITNGELRQHWFDPSFSRLKHLASFLQVSQETLRQRARKLDLPPWRSRFTQSTSGPNGRHGTNGSARFQGASDYEF
jgi:energy-coupling factor transporter ATP-binding protein EcfA2